MSWLRGGVGNAGDDAGVSPDGARLEVVTGPAVGSSVGSLVVVGGGGRDGGGSSVTATVSDGKDGKVGDAGVDGESVTDVEARVGSSRSGSSVGVAGVGVGEAAVPTRVPGLWRLCRCEWESVSAAQTTESMKSANKSMDVIFDVICTMMQIGVDC